MTPKKCPHFLPNRPPNSPPFFDFTELPIELVLVIRTELFLLLFPDLLNTRPFLISKIHSSCFLFNEPRRLDRTNSTASSRSTPASMRATVTKTGALPIPETQWIATTVVFCCIWRDDCDWFAFGVMENDNGSEQISSNKFL
jgi:hypothetical protein